MIETFASVLNNLYELTSFNNLKRANTCVNLIQKRGSSKAWQEYMSLEHIFYRHARVEISTTKSQLTKFVKSGKLKFSNPKIKPYFDGVKYINLGKVKLDDINQPYKITLTNNLVFNQGLFFVKPPNQYPGVIDFLRECCTWDDLGGLSIAQSFKLVDGNQIRVAILFEEPFIRNGDIVEISLPSKENLTFLQIEIENMGIPVVLV